MYLNDRQQHGFNVVLVNLIEHTFAVNAPADIYGDPPFTGTTFTTPNEAYFQHADYLVNGAAQRGMVVMLDPIYLGTQCGSEGWCQQVEAAATSDLQTWGQYVGNRYRNSPNILWVVGGDADPSVYPGVSAKLGAFATALNQADGLHPITAANSIAEEAITPWSGAAWLTVNNTYLRFGPYVYQGAITAYNVTPTMPFFEFEGYYENEHSMTPQQLRAQAYWTVLSGGMGYVFGNCPLWGFGAPQLASEFCASGASWQTQMDTPGAFGMQYLFQVLFGVAWQNLVPDLNHTTVTAGFGVNGGTDWASTERAADGSLVVSYIPTGNTVTVNMSQLKAPASAQWYDPSAGTYTPIAGSPFANTGSQQFAPPGLNATGSTDWVLLLTSP